MTDPTGSFRVTCYSGNGVGLNNPSLQWKEGIGPIPEGDYLIGWLQDGGKMGPNVLPLIPAPTNQMFGRSGFFGHGDNEQMDHTASDGCIVIEPESLRITIGHSPDRLLRVSAK
jgi:hypothetical protein